MEWRTCTDIRFRLPVTVSGQFASNNKFLVQVRSVYAHENMTEIPAALVNNNLEFSFKDLSLYDNSAVQLRIVTSEPKVETAWLEQTFSVYRKGDVKLSTATFSDTINLYDDYKIRFTGHTTSGGRVTLSDSSVFVLSSYGNAFNSVSTIVVGDQRTYTIAHAENECGAMTTEGRVTPIVNKTSIKTLSVDPQSACENAEVKISFSTSGTALTSQTKYKIRFSDVNSNDTKPNSIEVPARLTDGYLIARFPESFKVQYSQEFVAQVITENPALVGSATQRFIIYPKPSVSFNSPSMTINLGDVASINLAVSGLSPITVELSDGSIVRSDSPGQISVTLRPEQTTSYSIKSMSSGCQNNAITGDSFLEVKVNPGIKFTNETTPQFICAGTKTSIKFKSNAALTSGTQYWIEGKSLYNTDRFLLAATRVEDNLEFTVPQRADGYDSYSYKIITANPALESPATQLISVQTTPGIIYQNYNQYQYETPANVRLFYVLKGGGPYTLQTPEGKVLNLTTNGEFIYTFYLRQNQEFKFKSISNSCFKNDNIPGRTYTIVPTGSPALSLEPIKAITCNQDSIEVTFQKFGTFGAGNKFSIQAYANCCDYKTLATVTEGGKYKVKIAVDQFSHNASMRISSSNPVMFSEVQTFTVQVLPEQIKLYPEGTAENPIISLINQPYSQLSLTGGKGLPSSVDYTENGVAKTFINTDDYTTNIPITPIASKVNEYVIRSVTNVCGTVSVNLKSYIYLQPYRINIPATGYEGLYCLGSPITVPFGITDANNPSANFSLQIAKEGTNVFNTIGTSNSGRIVNSIIPSSTETGNYKMRISSSDGVISNERTLRIGTVPTATLGNQGQSGAIIAEPGRDVPMPMHFTGGPQWNVVFEDNSKQFYYNNEETRHVNPVKGGQYYIKSVSNICGYGTQSGMVTVQVKPAVNVSNNPFNICEGGTFQITYAILGDADLSDDYVRFELFNLSDNSVILLDSTKILAGIRTLKMPDALASGRYEVRCVLRKYNLSVSLNVGINFKPGAIISGNTIINSGEKTSLLVQITKDNAGQSEVTLSDGTKSYINGSAGSYFYIDVFPKQTTTYTIKSITNSCATGLGSGTATVEVNPISARAVQTTSISTPSGFGTCAGSEISVFYSTQGSFSAGNKMTVQISDSTGQKFTDIQTTGSSSPLKAVIPLNLPDGKKYRLRVNASDTGVSSGAFSEAVPITQKARARFAAGSVIYDGISNPHITVLLEGGSPWRFQYGTDLSVFTVETYNPTNVIELYQASANQSYKLFNVSNACGAGILETPSTIVVGVVTGTENPIPLTNVTIFPNPSQDILTLRFTSAAKRSIELFDLNGRSISKVMSVLQVEHLDISKLPLGIYLIQVEQDGRLGSYKIVKN